MSDARPHLNIALVTPTLLRRVDYAQTGKPVFLDEVPMRCWLCDGERPTTTFRSRAHVVPEALGNRRWLTREECDSCNHLMGGHESALVASITPYRVTSHHGRRGVKFRDPVTMARVHALDEHNNVLVTETSPSLPLIEERTNREFIVRIPVDGYKPLSICKSLARLALLLRPELREHYAHLREWILGRRTLATQILITGESSTAGEFQPTVFIFQDDQAHSADTTVATLLLYGGIFYWYCLPRHDGPITHGFLDRGLVEQLSGFEWKASFLTEDSRVRGHHASLTVEHSGRNTIGDDVE